MEEAVSTNYVSFPEAERFISGLRTFALDDVGSPAWMEQRAAIEKLNLQAHQNAITFADEFVHESLASHDKISTLVHELLVADVWRDRVFPLIGTLLYA